MISKSRELDIPLWKDWRLAILVEPFEDNGKSKVLIQGGIYRIID